MNRFVSLFLIGLALLMAIPYLPAVGAFSQRPDGGPYVASQIIRNAFNNATFYLQNLEDPNVFGSAAYGHTIIIGQTDSNASTTLTSGGGAPTTGLFMFNTIDAWDSNWCSGPACELNEWYIPGQIFTVPSPGMYTSSIQLQLKQHGFTDQFGTDALQGNLRVDIWQVSLSFGMPSLRVTGNTAGGTGSYTGSDIYNLIPVATSSSIDVSTISSCASYGTNPQRTSGSGGVESTTYTCTGGFGTYTFSFSGSQLLSGVTYMWTLELLPNGFPSQRWAAPGNDCAEGIFGPVCETGDGIFINGYCCQDSPLTGFGGTSLGSSMFMSSPGAQQWLRLSDIFGSGAQRYSAFWFQITGNTGYSASGTQVVMQGAVNRGSYPLSTAMGSSQCSSSYSCAIGSYFPISVCTLPDAFYQVNSVTFWLNRPTSGNNFDGRLVAHIYTVGTDGLPASSIEYSNTMRASPSGFPYSTGYTQWNFTFSQIGKGYAQLTCGNTYFADIELRDYLGGGDAIGIGMSTNNGGYPFQVGLGNSMVWGNGGWGLTSNSGNPIVVVGSVGLVAMRQYTVIKEYPGFPLRFDSIHDDFSPWLGGDQGAGPANVTGQTEMIHEVGMLRQWHDIYGFGSGIGGQCGGTNSGVYDTFTPITGYFYDTKVNNYLEDSAWANVNGNGLLADGCPSDFGANTEPYISDAAFKPTGPVTSCYFGIVGVNAILCRYSLQYAMTSSTQRYDSVYMGNQLVASLSPTASGTITSVGTQRNFESFRYSARHGLQLASMFYGYVLGPHYTVLNPYTNFTVSAQLMQNLLVDYGFGEDVYDPLFNADYNLADDYFSDSSSSGPYHDCYVYGQMPGNSAGADQYGLGTNIGLDYYPYRSAVCSNMPGTLNTYLCFETGCAPFTQPDGLYLALHARHLLNKYIRGTDGAGALTSAESDINSICFDGNGVCKNAALSGSYSTIRLATYLAAMAALERILGLTTSYSISGNGCPSGASFSCKLTQRIHDVASILWKLQLGAGSWSSISQCGVAAQNFPGNFEDIASGQNICSPYNIGGFMVGYVPGDAPYAFKSPRGAFIDFAESAYCAFIGQNCVNMATETPFATPTNTETTIVSTMALLEYYKLVYQGDILLDGKVGLGGLVYCLHHYNGDTGGAGLRPFSAVGGYLFMCDGKNRGGINIQDVILIEQMYNADFRNWNYIENGGFNQQQGTSFFKWFTTPSSPSSSDYAVVISPTPAPSTYSVQLGNAVNPSTNVSQVMNPTNIRGIWTLSFSFYLPNLPDLNTPGAYPTLAVELDPERLALWIQPSTGSLGGVMQDCVALLDILPGFGKAGHSCFASISSGIIRRGAWNSVQVFTQAGSDYINVVINGSNVVSLNDSTVSGNYLILAEFTVANCGSYVFAGSMACASSWSTLTGTSSDYYDVTKFSMTVPY